jgi:CBS domain-containing protein
MKAKEAMTRQVRTVSPDSTVAEAALLMRQSGHGTLPVVDSEEHLLGVVTKARLVRRCLPEYLEQVGDLYRTQEFRPFRDRASEVGLLAVRDVMDADPLSATEETPLAEVAAQMITQHVRQVPIVRDGRLVGIVGMQDIIDRIAWPEPGQSVER